MSDMITYLGVLNVGAGDTKLSFDKDNLPERERAARIVTDMLKRGYAILVQVGEKGGKPLYQRAEGFDPDTCEYLIVGTPADDGAIGGPAPIDIPAGRGKPKKHKRLDAATTPGVAIARSAGG